MVTATPIQTKDWKWDVTLNWGKNETRNVYLDEKIKRHLENLGISVNSELEVLSVSGGSVIVRVKEGRLALDRDMATRIFVAVKEA